MNASFRFFSLLVASGISAGQVYGITIAGFDGGVDTPLTLQSFGTPPGPSVQPVGGNPGGYLQLTPAINSQHNFATFDRTDSGPFSSSAFSFQFRITAIGQSADGFSFSYANTANYGTSGGIGGAPFTAEDPAAAGILGFGFDTWSNQAPFDNPSQPSGSDYEEISLFYNGALISRVDDTRLLSNPLTLDDGNWHTAAGVINFALGTTSLAVDGQAIFNNVAVPGLTPFESRIMFAGRTGGESEDTGIDNINVTWGSQVSTVPEGGSTLVLLASTLVALAIYRRKAAIS